MNNQLMALIERHQNQMANLQTTLGQSDSVFANVLAEFAIGESEGSLSAVLDSIEQIIEYAESQRIELGGDSAFALLRTLVNTYYASQDIDQQDRALGLLGRLLSRLSRKEIDRKTAEEIIRVVGLAQRGVSEESRNFQRFLQIMLSVIDLLTTEASLLRRKHDLVRSLNRILRENRNRQIVSDALSALVLLCDYLDRSEREGLLQSMTEAIHTDQLEVFRRCLQVVVRFSGQRFESAQGRAETEPTTTAIVATDENAISHVPDQIAQAIIDQLPRPEFSAEIVQRLDVLFILIAPAESQQRAALMDMIAKIVESEQYSQIDTVLKAFRPLYPQLNRREQVALATGVAGLFNRGDLRYLDLAVSVLDVFVADLPAADQTPIVRGLVRSLQSEELPRIHVVFELLPESYSGFHTEGRTALAAELCDRIRAGQKDMVERAIACILAIRASALNMNQPELAAEVSRTVTQAIQTVLHETGSFPLAEYLIEFAIKEDMQSLYPECLKAVERFRTEQGRAHRVFELLEHLTRQMREHDELHASLPKAVALLGTYMQTHLEQLLEALATLLKIEAESIDREVHALAKAMLTTLQPIGSIMRVVNFVLSNEALQTAELIDAGADALCSQDLHEGEAEAFGLVIRLYDASASAAPARESIAIGLRNATRSASAFRELERVTAVVVAAPELPHFRKEELEKELLVKLVPLLRAVDHRDETTDLLHRLCAQMTHTGSVALRTNLMNLLTETDLPFAAYRAISDLVFTHNALHIDLPEACAEKIAAYARVPEMTDEALQLIADSWQAAPEKFKIQLASEMREVVELGSFVYTPERYALLLRLIEYVNLITESQQPGRDDTQLHYVKVLIRFSQTPELHDRLYDMIRHETGVLRQVLLPKPRIALSVWLLLSPLAQHMPYSKLKASTDGWKLPPPMQKTIGLRQISTIFEHLLSQRSSPNQYAQMRRAFINALGQMADSEEEAVVEMQVIALDEFKTFVAGLSDTDKRDWEKVCDQIWQEDSRKGTPDVDRIRSGRVRKELRQQVKEIFSNGS